MKRVQPVAPPQFPRQRDEAKNPTSGASAGGHASSCTRRPKCICARVTENINDQTNLFHITRLCFSPSFHLWDVNRKKDSVIVAVLVSVQQLKLLNICSYFYLCLIISLLSWLNFTDFCRFWSIIERPARRVERHDRRMKTDFGSSVVVMSEQDVTASETIIVSFLNLFFKHDEAAPMKPDLLSVQYSVKCTRVQIITVSTRVCLWWC